MFDHRGQGVPVRLAELVGNPTSLEMAVLDAAMQLQTLLGIGRCHAQALIQGGQAGQALAGALALAERSDDGTGEQQACVCPGPQQATFHPFVKITGKLCTDRARHCCTARLSSGPGQCAVSSSAMNRSKLLIFFVASANSVLMPGGEGGRAPSDGRAPSAAGRDDGATSNSLRGPAATNQGPRTGCEFDPIPEPSQGASSTLQLQPRVKAAGEGSKAGKGQDEDTLGGATSARQIANVSAPGTAPPVRELRPIRSDDNAHTILANTKHNCEVFKQRKAGLPAGALPAFEKLCALGKMLFSYGTVPADGEVKTVLYSAAKQVRTHVMAARGKTTPGLADGIQGGVVSGASIQGGAIGDSDKMQDVHGNRYNRARLDANNLMLVADDNDSPMSRIALTKELNENCKDVDSQPQQPSAGQQAGQQQGGGNDMYSLYKNTNGAGMMNGAAGMMGGAAGMMGDTANMTPPQQQQMMNLMSSYSMAGGGLGAMGAMGAGYGMGAGMGAYGYNPGNMHMFSQMGFPMGMNAIGNMHGYSAGYGGGGTGGNNSRGGGGGQYQGKKNNFNNSQNQGGGAEYGGGYGGGYGSGGGCGAGAGSGACYGAGCDWHTPVGADFSKMPFGDGNMGNYDSIGGPGAGKYYRQEGSGMKRGRFSHEKTTTDDYQRMPKLVRAYAGEEGMREGGQAKDYTGERPLREQKAPGLGPAPDENGHPNPAATSRTLPKPRRRDKCGRWHHGEGHERGRPERVKKEMMTGLGREVYCSFRTKKGKVCGQLATGRWHDPASALCQNCLNNSSLPACRGFRK